MSTGRPFTRVLCTYYCTHVSSRAVQCRITSLPSAWRTERTVLETYSRSLMILCVPPYCCSEMLWTQHFVLLCVSLASYWDVFSKSPAAGAAATLRFYLINCGLSVSLSDSFLWPLFDSAFLPSGLQQTVSYSQTFPNKQQSAGKRKLCAEAWHLMRA